MRVGPCLRPTRCTELTLMPMWQAIVTEVQCVVSVAAAARASTSVPSGEMRGGRGFSRTRPGTPSAINRSCHPHTDVLLVQVRRVSRISRQLSAVSGTISARQTCFWGLSRPPQPPAVGVQDIDGDSFVQLLT